jgi:hypothetical protein
MCGNGTAVKCRFKFKVKKGNPSQTGRRGLILGTRCQLLVDKPDTRRSKGIIKSQTDKSIGQ